MRNLLVLCAVGLSLSACADGWGSREANGALIGGAGGALIGGLASHSVGGAVVGGAAGAATGAVVANLTRPRYYYYRHHRHCYYSPAAGRTICRYYW